ncbi:MAG: 50S ribosomal protein L30 [Halobacteriovoraceae bacterium]|nr:50S ribosomal protein L30 [Halobacteriovoraceae bacterium]
MSTDKTITVKLIRSTICCTQVQKETVAGLGLRKPGHEKKLENTPAVRGMIKKVIHLLKITFN